VIRQALEELGGEMSSVLKRIHATTTRAAELDARIETQTAYLEQLDAEVAALVAEKKEHRDIIDYAKRVKATLGVA
jgi:septal ring factor EnvC (AmiA/AmiB activator)